MYRFITVFILSVTMYLSGCATYSINNDLNPVDISQIPLPRNPELVLNIIVNDESMATSGGFGNAQQESINRYQDNLARALTNSGYFSRVNRGPSGNGITVTVSNDFGGCAWCRSDLDWLASLLTAGIIPAHDDMYYSTNVRLETPNKKAVRLSYDGTGDTYSSISPLALIFGSTLGTMEEVHAASIATRIISDLNRLGYLHY